MILYKDISTIDIAFKLGLKQGKNGNFHCFNKSRHNHGDKNPSLSINDKGFNCFGCGKKGNNIELIKQVLKIPFRDSLKWLEEYFDGEKNLIKMNTQNQNLRQDINKYHTRLIKKGDPRYIFISCREVKLAEPTEKDIENIKRYIGKSYRLETLKKTGIKINQSNKRYGIIFPRGQILFNPYNKKEYIHVEGRTDYLTAIELGLDEHFAIISNFNKSAHIQINSGKQYFILDKDVTVEGLKERIKYIGNLLVGFIRLPSEYGDLSDFFNKGKCKKKDILQLIDSAKIEMLTKGSDDIYKLLDQENSITNLYLSQDFKLNRLWYGLNTKNGIMVINSKREYKFLDELKNNSKYNVLSKPSTFAIEPVTVKKYILETRSIEEDYKEGKYLCLSLYQRIKNHLERYIYFFNKNQSSLLAVWILSTYIFTIFRYFPYLHVRAEKGSGKSRLIEIMSNLAFNGKLAVGLSAAVLFRTIEKNRNSLFLDEVENYRTSDKELYGSIMGILNSGFHYKGQTERVEKIGGGFEIKSYSTYSPKCFAGINNLDDVLKDRTITIKLLRKKTTEKINRYKQDHNFLHEVKNITQDCYQFGLKYAETLFQFYNKKEKIEGIPDELSDREKDIYEPLFVIGNLIQLEAERKAIEQVDVLNRLNQFAMAGSEDRRVDDAERNTTAKAVKILSEIIEWEKVQPVKETSNGKIYRREDLYKIFKNEYQSEFPWIDSQITMVRLFGNKLDLRPGNYLHEPKQKQYLISTNYLQDMKERFLS